MHAINRSHLVRGDHAQRAEHAGKQRAYRDGVAHQDWVSPW